MKKVERAFYSLYSLGCKPGNLSAKTKEFIHKQFCKSILRYGLESLYLTNYKLREYDIWQNIILKQSIGISKYSHTTALINVLNVERIEEIYIKHKVYFLKQIQTYTLTSEIYSFLS